MSFRLVAASFLPLLLTGLCVAQDGATPLGHPRAPRALRGLVIVVDPLPVGDQGIALRGAQYAARLLERASADVALTRTGAGTGSHRDAAGLATESGAHLVVRLSAAEAAPEETPVVLRLPDEDAAVAELAGRLEQRLADEFGACDQEPPIAGIAPITVDVRILAVPAGEDSADVCRHRPAVHRLFLAMADWATAERDRIEDTWDERRGRTSGDDDDRAPAGRPFWPIDRPPETESEVAGLIEGWRRGLAMDRTQVWLEVEVRRIGDDGWEMSGATELPALESAVRRMLERHGVNPLRGSLRALPDPSLGDDPFGITVGHAALTWSRPGSHTGLRTLDGDDQVQQTELLPGEPVRLLDSRNGYLLVHALSGYLGWTPESAVRRCGEDEHRAAVDEATGPDERGVLVAEAAVRNLGVPYVFGGRSQTGLDCSGLCQTSWSGQGVFLPRDARMQMLTGALVATKTRPAPLRPGDLLFFADATGRISHVALSLGGTRFIHATPPQVTVGSLDPEDPWYDRLADRFVVAKRPAR